MTEGGVSTSLWDAPLTMLGGAIDLVSQASAFLGLEMLGHHMLESKLQIYLSHPFVAFVHNFLKAGVHTSSHKTSGIISANERKGRGRAKK